MASTISAGTTSGTALNMAGDTTGILQLQTNGTTTAVTIDTSQNVGIGTVSPTNLLSLNLPASTTKGMTIDNAGNAVAGFTANAATGEIRIGGIRNAGWFPTFYYNNTEAMRIDTIGALLIGLTSNASLGAVTGVQAFQAGYLYSTVNNDAGGGFARKGSDGNTVIFRRDTSTVGSISVTGSSTSYNTSSDYRLKENIAPMQNALNVVQQLKPVTYTWKSTGKESKGFIAHELAEIIPECVTGQKDALDKDGNPEYQGIDTSFLVATLTAAIQELNAKVDAQAAEIQALKGNA
jgi:hypothetical protein